MRIFETNTLIVSGRLLRWESKFWSHFMVKLHYECKTYLVSVSWSSNYLLINILVTFQSCFFSVYLVSAVALVHLCPKGRLCCLFNLVAKTLSFVKESFHSVCLFALVNILTVQELYVINLQGCVSTYHTAYLCLLESHLYRQHVMCLLKRCQILTLNFLWLFLVLLQA